MYWHLPSMGNAAARKGRGKAAGAGQGPFV